MPMNYALYPANWKAISLAVRAREQNRCKWCNVPNGQLGARDVSGNWHNWPELDSYNSDVGFALFGNYPKIIKIILTVAHLGVSLPDGSPGDKHNKMDVRDENLAALCQRCHLNYDRDEHKTNAAKTRHKKILKTGQMELLNA